MPGNLLHCPIRGRLIVAERAADGLAFTEEKLRIDCIKFLLEKGYPASNFKIETTLWQFGSGGRNSFRTDIAILDVPTSQVAGDLEILKPHIKLIAEIKRDNANARVAIRTQVGPALGFLPDVAALGIYWDDVEQRLFYRTLEGTTATTHETAVAALPPWGQPFVERSLHNENLRPTNLLPLFKKIEDHLHVEVPDTSRRFEIMLQLLLVKLHDENIHQAPGDEMSLQDFSNAPLPDTEVTRLLEGQLRTAVRYYGRYLPDPVPTTFLIRGDMLRSVASLLAPVRFLGSKRDILQSFYMYFMKGLKKWDMAQYFTPNEVIDFIVSLVNPRAGDQIKDPACGSGDFLTSAIHHARANGANISDAVWGADNSENAVQVCVLNMVLNGDGKGNITTEDSLERVADYENQFSVVLCNPPFGVRIVERRFDVLRQFDLGRKWAPEGDTITPTDEALPKQQVGILFAELCIRQAIGGERIGIILPNGYLGNRSQRYVTFREWLLRHARVVAVVAFPRFTFKKSGADVSASAVILEKRVAPLARASDSEDYPFFVGVLESVGWSVSDKKASRIYRRNEETGDLITDDKNEPLIDADFDRVLAEIAVSPVSSIFRWLPSTGQPQSAISAHATPYISSVISRDDLSLDPKRWCPRVTEVRTAIERTDHFALDSVVTVLSETPREISNRQLYRYVPLKDVSDGVINPATLRGWQLPDRARHTANPGDIFVGSIWGSVGKWFIAGTDCESLLVSNGFHRLHMKPGSEDYLVDVIAGLNSEDYRIQARAFCTGSDGLAEISPEDLGSIILPRVTDAQAREALQSIAERLLEGRATVADAVATLRQSGSIPTSGIESRLSNWVQV